jgi:endonuclease-8
MPEKPEVQITADAISSILVGKKLVSLEYDSGSRYYKKGLKNIEELRSMLPLNLLKIWSKGKKIIFEFEKNVYIVNSLGMEGKWLRENIKHSNLWLTMSDKQILYYNDVRHMGEIEIYLDQQTFITRINKIGPDLLNDKIKFKDWLKVVRNTRIEKMQICAFMLKQNYFSGIGNYIRAEALYRANVRPDATLLEMSDEDHELVMTASIQVIKESYASRGCTLRSYWDVNGDTGKFKVAVYGKKSDPKGNPVVEDVFSDGRTTHWVPNIQIYPPKVTSKKLTEIDFVKLERSIGTGKDKYTLVELQNLARERNLKTSGTKTNLKERLCSLYNDK